MKSLVGQVINFRYEILEKTGEGSLFTVYRTRDKVMNRLAAVKVLKEDYASDPEFASRLMMHARRLLPVNHPNVTRVYEAEVSEDAVYVAEEHVRGIDLKERIRRIAPFTVASAVDVALAVAQAMDHLHTNGIIHGDLRPHKILIGPEGEVKVTGAGLNQAFSEHEERRTLALMRTAHYSAPEAFEGRPAGEQTDIYSLGIIMYEMLTGTLPFTGESPIAVATKHARDEPPAPRTINAGIPRGMEAIILKCLEKNPSSRYASMKELVRDLRQVQESLRVGRPVTAPAPGEPVEEAPEEKQESILKGLLKALLLVAVVAAVVFALVMGLVRGTPGEVEVPDVIGMNVDEARSLLAQDGLSLNVVREDFNDRYEEGQIYFSDPPSGQPVREQSAVQVYVSKGSRMVTVPGVQGMELDRARRVLSDAGFTLGDIQQEFSSSVDDGDVISQSPRAGLEVRRGSTAVDLVVSSGPEPRQPEPEVTPQPTPEPEVQEDEDDEEADSSSTTAQPRKLRVRFEMPEGTPSTRVQVLVKDQTGLWTALDRNYSGGDTVSATFSATGAEVEIRTLMDGKEVDRQVK